MRIESFSTSVNTQQAKSDDTKNKGIEKEIFKEENFKNINKEKSQKSKEQGHYKEDELIQNIEKANQEIIIYDRKFEFEIHEDTKKIMVKIIDINSEEIIREIPPEKILDLVAKMWELTGLFIDEKV